MADEESSSCEFRVAAAHARACLADLGDEDMLKIYGLYKQVCRDFIHISTDLQ